VTKSVAVRFDDRLAWVYDEPLGILLKYMIDIATEIGLDRGPQEWTTFCENLAVPMCF
jgi:hypothetical protein